MIYLDNAATTFPKPVCVYDAMDRVARSGIGNPGRAGHQLALAAEKIVADCRVRLNELLGGAGPDRFVFTLNGTDALNMAIKGILRPGDHVISGCLEHNSVRRPLMSFAKRNGDESVTWLTQLDSGRYSVDEIAMAVRPTTRLVAICHASNVTGVVQPVEEISKLCRSRGVTLLIDGAQTGGSVPIDLKSLGADLFAAPGHKALFGPTGIGFLYVAPGAEIAPWREGGTGSNSESPFQPEEFPFHLEAGTPNVVGIAGLLAGVEFILQTGVAAVERHERKLHRQLIEGIRRLANVELLNDIIDRPQVGISLFRLSQFESAEVAAILDQNFDICVRSGLHCSPEAHRSIGTFPDGAVRASVGFMNSANEIAGFLDAIEQIASTGC